MADIDKVLNEKNIKDSVDELREDIKDFDDIKFMYMIWGNRKDGVVKERYCGNGMTLLASLERAKFALLVDMELGEEDEDEDD